MPAGAVAAGLVGGISTIVCGNRGPGAGIFAQGFFGALGHEGEEFAERREAGDFCGGEDSAKAEAFD